MKEDLSEMRKIAETATPGPWKEDVGQRGDCVVWGPNGRFLLNAQAEPHWLEYPDETRSVAFDVDRRDCTYIATFDPPTVLELIDQIEYYKRENETLAALGKANHEWNVDNRTQLKGRLERAEQAEQRVRQLHSAEPARYYGTDLNPHREYDCSGCGEGRAWPCATIRILDGDTSD